MVRLPAGVQRKALRSLKKRGITVHVGALDHLYTSFQETPQTSTFDAFLDAVFELLTRPDGAADGILTKALAQSIGERLARQSQRNDGNVKASIDFIDIFSVPRWRARAAASNVSAASASSTSGRCVSAPRRPISSGPPDMKADVFRARYELILSKTLRGDTFCGPLSDLGMMSGNKTYYHISNIDGLDPRKGSAFVLGLLSQYEEGAWFLEDLHGSVRVDLSGAKVTSGLHTEGSIVLAWGDLVEEGHREPVFEVKALGNPNPETREETMRALGTDANLFGGHFEMADEQHLLEMEKGSESTFFAFFSDVALDNPRVHAGLRHLFQSYMKDDYRPRLIVFMGDFLSHPFGDTADDMDTLIDKFTELGEMLANDFKEIVAETTFVIIPGPTDPGPGNVLPRPSLPAMITEGFVEAVGADHVHLASNPCRIRYLTQEIVVMRDDLMNKMVRRCAVNTDTDEYGAISYQFTKSLIDQSYLCPLPPLTRPVLWQHDHAMWMFPTPHTLVIGDKPKAFNHEYSGCLAMNPGPFEADFSFQVYIPAKREAHTSSLDSEDRNEDKPNKDSPERPSTPASESAEEGREDEAMVEPEHDHDDNDENDDDGEIVIEPEISDDEEKISLAAGRGKAIESSGSEREDEDEAGEEGDVSDAESDDSVLLPAEGVQRIDIKSMVRESLQDNFAASALPHSQEDIRSNSGDENDVSEDSEVGPGGEL